MLGVKIMYHRQKKAYNCVLFLFHIVYGWVIFGFTPRIMCHRMPGLIKYKDSYQSLVYLVMDKSEHMSMTQPILYNPHFKNGNAKLLTNLLLWSPAMVINVVFMCIKSQGRIVFHQFFQISRHRQQHNAQNVIGILNEERKRKST